MKVETPLMAVRRLTGLSSTYMDAIYTSFITMRGSGATLLEDFSSGLFTMTNYSRAADNTLTGDGSSDTAVVKTWAATGATSDLIIVAVGTYIGTTNQFKLGGGGASQRFLASALLTGAALFKDGAATDTADTGTGDVVPSVGDTIVMVGARDQGVDVYGYCYNLTTGAVAWDKTGSPDGATGDITPLVDTMTLAGFTKVYGLAAYVFAAGGLPATWKADMLAMAKTLVAAKS